MLTVHHLNNSRSQRVLWLLEELGVPYEIVRYQRQPDMRAPKELRAIHPLGKSPVITDNGNTIAESGAIIEYLIATYGNGRLIPPPNTPERLRFTYWLHYAEGSAMQPLLLKLLFTLMPKRAPALLRPLVRKVSNQARDHPGQSAAQAAHGLLGRRACKERVVRRQRVHRSRHPDELSAGSGASARRARAGPSQGDGVPRAHPRAACLCARIGKGRAVSGGTVVLFYRHPGGARSANPE
ncbi:glutathione S-transferase [Bradyrhizobium ottawaense]